MHGTLTKIIIIYHSLITNLKVSTQAKNIIFQKSSYKNKPIMYGAKIP
jgi:hypothetical protein